MGCFELTQPGQVATLVPATRLSPSRRTLFLVGEIEGVCLRGNYVYLSDAGVLDVYTDPRFVEWGWVRL